ncbi:putative uncharacterized protein PRO1854 [Macaca mulatta]
MVLTITYSLTSSSSSLRYFSGSSYIINKYRANDKFFCMYVCMYVCIEKILLYKTHWMTPIFLKVVIKARRIKHHFKIHVPSQFFILITITKY